MPLPTKGHPCFYKTQISDMLRQQNTNTMYITPLREARTPLIEGHFFIAAE